MISNKGEIRRQITEYYNAHPHADVIPLVYIERSGCGELLEWVYRDTLDDPQWADVPLKEGTIGPYDVLYMGLPIGGILARVGK